MIDETYKETYKDARESLETALVNLDKLEENIREQKENVSSAISDLSTPVLGNIDEDALKEFINEPYAIVPRKKDEWLVVAPKFVPFNIGWLERSTAAWNFFIVNKYVNWLGDVPEELKSKFKFKPHLPLSVVDGMLITGKSHQEEAWNRYRKYLVKKDGKDRCRITKGKEFKLIAEMIEDGIMPFAPNPIDPNDIKRASGKIELRSYQKKAWNKFKETGAVGIFWSFSAGKTYFGAYLCDRIKGDKLIVVPTNTLKEQWKKYLETYTDCNEKEYTITTYQSLHKYSRREFALILFDECHSLPANTFIKGATLKTKYRVGFSASPYREDGRTAYIFALTGYPIGMDWNDLLEMGVIEAPDIMLYIVPNKTAKLDTLVAQPLKTMIFCDSIQKGNSLSKRYGVPFVHGATKNRLDIIKENNLVIVSRVGDEGISLPDIERTIEFDFLFGSRRQEGQRMGRVMHGKGKGQHIIMMSENEFDRYSKRLDAIYEKGFKIRVIRE